MGVNILAYSHFDEYLVDFTSFKPGRIDDDVFEVPDMCKEEGRQHTEGTAYTELQQASRKAGVAGVAASIAALPWVHLPGDLRSTAGLCYERAYHMVGHKSVLLDCCSCCCCHAATLTLNLRVWSQLRQVWMCHNLPAGWHGASTYGQLRQYSQQHIQRLTARVANQQMVGSWNSANAARLGYKLAANRFIDWLPEEYSSLMTAKRSTATSEKIKVDIC